MKEDSLLILLPNWIGDAVMATPLLNSLKTQLRNTRIILAGLPHICNLFEESPLADEIVPVAKNKAAIPIASKAVGIWKKSRDLKQLNARRVLLLPGSLSSALTARLSKIPVRMGYNRDRRSFLLTSSIEHPQSFRTFHRVRYYLELLNLLPECDIDTSQVTMESNPLTLHITAQAQNWADDFLSCNDVKGHIVAIHGGGAYGPSKRWAPQSFVTTLIEAHKTKEFTVLIVGSKEDISNGELITRKLDKAGIRTVCSAGKTSSVMELAGLLEKADVFLSNDSGPMHIAAALSLPQIAVFTSTSTDFTCPWNTNAVVFSSNIECSPCFQRDCPVSADSGKAGFVFPCHEDIDPVAVGKSLAQILQQASNTP